MGNIIGCLEDGYDGIYPTTLRQVGIDRILKRTIIEWSPYKGTYGMGGPGFFGLHLDKNEYCPKEWLLLILWGAAEWLLLDGRWVEAHWNQYHIQKPLYSNVGIDRVWDNFSPLVVGSIIHSAVIEDDYSAIYLQQGEQTHLLEIPKDTTLLPKLLPTIYGSLLRQRLWKQEESQLDAWVISQSGKLYLP